METNGTWGTRGNRFHGDRQATVETVSTVNRDEWFPRMPFRVPVETKRTFLVHQVPVETATSVSTGTRWPKKAEVVSTSDRGFYGYPFPTFRRLPTKMFRR